jgi:hypothetical protein
MNSFYSGLLIMGITLFVAGLSNAEEESQTIDPGVVMVTPSSATRPYSNNEQKTGSPQVKDLVEKEMGASAPFSKGVPKALRSQLETTDNPVAPVPTWDLKDPWSAWCDANWTQTCEGFESWSPPDGWDICKFNVVEESKSHGEWAVVFADPKTVRVHLKSWGSHAFFDQWGGWVRVRLSSAQLIPSSATPEQRKPLNCSYNNGGGSAGQGMSEYLFCAAYPTNPNGSFGIQMCADYIFENGEKKYTKGPYPCGVCFRQ